MKGEPRQNQSSWVFFFFLNWYLYLYFSEKSKTIGEKIASPQGEILNPGGSHLRRQLSKTQN